MHIYHKIDVACILQMCHMREGEQNFVIYVCMPHVLMPMWIKRLDMKSYMIIKHPAKS